MPTFGRLQEFRLEEEEDWEQYIARMKHYFSANDIDDANKQKAILLSACGASTYKLMCDLFAPAKPGDKSFDELVTAVQNHLKPKPSEIVQRFKFHTRLRQEHETVSTYVAELRHLSRDCNFTGNSLESMLRDRLVCGINNDRIQRRLLAEKELTFAKALEMATAMELAEKSAVDLRGGVPMATAGGKKDTVVSVDKVSSSPFRSITRGEDQSGGKSQQRSIECWFCKGKGHMQRQCQQYRAERERRRRRAKSDTVSKGATVKNVDDSDSDAELFTIFRTQNKEKPYMVTVSVDGVPIEMEVDTGASLTVISEGTLKSIRRGVYLPLKKCKRRLKTYTGNEIPVLGECQVAVTYKESTPVTCEVIVVKGTGPDLLGRDWLKHVKLDWSEIFSVHSGEAQAKDVDLELILGENAEVFEEVRGTIKGVKASIFVDPTAQPRYFKPRPVPYALRDKVSQELDRLEAEGTIEKVQFSDWAAPIVTVVKPDKSLRICGDYKVTVNVASKLDNYPIPKTDDLLARLGGGKFFTKLDLTQAYQQLELDEASKEFTTINTHQGLYRYNRLPYGVSSAPGIFQRAIEGLLRGPANVYVRIDDILVAGKTRDEHLTTLRTVLQRLKEAGAKLKKKKCVFMATEVIYLGLKIDQTGIQPVPEKVKAIQEMPQPTDVKQLQAYLGMVNYYSRFLPQLSTVLAPLYALLQKGVKWCWEDQHERAWTDSKRLLQSPHLLVHFDSTKHIILSCDASNYGVGAVISHRMEDGSERPVAFASRTMNSAEKNYSQVEKEALAIIFGIKKFHQYLYGQKFEIITDHKPLLGLFSENKQIPAMAAPRIQRWAITLAAYEYQLKFKEGKKHSNADGLSRLPLEVTVGVKPERGETVLLMEQVETMPVTAKQIRQWTSTDPVLSRVKDFVQKGWPERSDDKRFQPYFARKTELSLVDGCLLWGTRAVVPPKGRKRLLEDLHESHPGMTRMKALARSYIWWPNLDSDIEAMVRSCPVCQAHRNMPSSAPLHPWEWPNRPWSRLHVDYAGPFQGKMFLVIIDAHSKWMDVYPMNSSTSTATIEKLRQSFAIHGLPDTLVSDNGTCFTSEEFEIFMKMNGIKHIKSAPYHAATNGLAERAVQTMKQGLKKLTQGSMETRVARFLSMYRITPQTTTGLSPAELLFNRKVRTRLDLVQPSVERQVVQKQSQQKLNHDHADVRKYQVGDLVNIKNFSVGPKWLPGVVVQITGPLSYMIQLPDGRMLRRHVDHVLPHVSDPEVPENCERNVQTNAQADPCIQPPLLAESPAPPSDYPSAPAKPLAGPAPNLEVSQPPDLEYSDPGDLAMPVPILTPAAAPAMTPPHESRPTRQRRLPERFKDFVLHWFRDMRK